MADDDAPREGHEPPHGGGKKIAGLPRNYVIYGGVAAGVGVLAWFFFFRKKGTGSTSTQAVITGSTGDLGALLKDWQQVPTSSSGTSTGQPSAGSGSGGGGGYYGGGYYPTSAGGTGTGPASSATGTAGAKTTTTAKTTSKVTANPPKAKTAKTTTPAKVKTTVTYTSYTVKPGDTLAALSKQFGITTTQLAHSNVYVAGEVAGDKKVGQTLGTGAGLKTGQVLKVPHYTTTKG